ncbi:MAG: hypothetical protein QOC87_2117 [Actinomycetota bacterium]|jgi:cellobiose phosphorylase|nr:hypothetical protein [Actinomycetota bacterium]
MLADEAMTVVAVGLISAGSTPTECNPCFFCYQSPMSVHQAHFAAEVERAEVPCSHSSDFIGLFGRKLSPRLVFERARRTQADRGGDLLCVCAVYVDPRASRDIKDFGKSI